MKISRALIIAEPWIGHLLDGRKTWEMRSQNASLRGWMGLIRKGSGAVVGVARLIDVGKPLSQDEMIATFDKHRIPENMIVSGEVANWNTPWKLADIRPLASPVPYSHKKGAVTWVALHPDVQDAIATQMEDASDCEPQVQSPATKVASSPQKPATKEVMSIQSNSTPQDTADARVIGHTTLTEANIRHGHIYLRSFFDRFPKGAVGGSSKASMATESLMVQTSMGHRFETDLDGLKKFFRARAPIRAFFEATKARPGDEVVVEQLAPYSYRMSLQR
jgi:hypothetical protein